MGPKDKRFLNSSREIILSSSPYWLFGGTVALTVASGSNRKRGNTYVCTTDIVVGNCSFHHRQTTLCSCGCWLRRENTDFNQNVQAKFKRNVNLVIKKETPIPSLLLNPQSNNHLAKLRFNIQLDRWPKLTFCLTFAWTIWLKSVFIIYFFGITIKKMVQKRVLYWNFRYARLHKGHNAHITHLMWVVTGSTLFGFTSALCSVCRSVGCG